ncbi:Stk1 family PASTA domain-containing Ser/Thr kinase [Bombilactobacillus folatiphilus]|uniref:non-specific serine/threonine protein kinase n=1 Tax=Bombilactobacillus folatiphilus TaxID=2923362 RepID=A0ABY4P7U6_9LACO|nr:Stk1 family PASTA domain-containing Ser/Thr kinase [Bombilactobacillus folatiphilus]UQS81616.1 Stk1 family PASTA domain-containing Ser/Thr kinase [Bombilactobacillus folatiphilus]
MINKGDLIAERYLILDALGEGGMSNVYLAEDTFLHRKVALKSLRLDLTDNQQFRERFQRESRTMSELSSPYIVNILDIGDDNFPYIVMEYVQGPSLKKYLRQNYPLAQQKILDLMHEILQGVSVAHKHGIIHRDLKPQNVFITTQGHAKVGDFGIALALGEQSITQSDSTIGSVHYMAPERVRGAQANIQSDIYSLGIILFEMLTGHLPFDAETSLAVAAKHFREPIPDLSQIDASIPTPLQNVVLKATAKDPNQRYGTVEEMAQDLATSLDIARQKEPLFVPDLLPNSNDEETKVLTSMDHSTLSHSSKKPEHENQSQASKTKHWYQQSKYLLGILGLVVIFISCLLFWNWYNRKEVKVPDVSDLSLNQAQAVLNNSGLKVGQISHQSSAKVKKHNIIRSLPPKGGRLKSGTKVNLIRSTGPLKRSVPNVVGMNYYAAKQKLKRAGFKVKRENHYSSMVNAGSVISQAPKANHKKISQKKTIHLRVSLGQKNHGFVVKDVTGYNLRGVQDYANEEGLHLVMHTVVSDNIDKGLVVSQNPVAGSRVLRGADLVVNLSSGPVPDNSNDSKQPVSHPDSSDIQNVSRTVNVHYDSQSNSGSNVVKIYIKDANHSLTDVYQTLNITSDTPVTINLQLNKGQSGQYIVERDGQTVDSQVVTAN